MQPKYQILSPDGFPISCDSYYRSRKQALEAFKAFKARYITQGYYSTSNRERIALEDLLDYCELVII